MTRANEKAAGVIPTPTAAHENSLRAHFTALQAERAKAIEVCQKILTALLDDATDLATVDELGYVLREEIWASRVLQVAVRKGGTKKRG